MVATIPPLLVEDPTQTFPLRYGIFTAANGPLDLPVHGRNGGLRYVTSICADGFGYDVACIGATASKVPAFSAGSTTVTGTPFIIFATQVCGTVGYTYDEQRAMVVERLKSVEQGVLEDIFSQSTFGSAPGLITGDGIATLAGAGDAIQDVVGELERAMYCGAVSYGPPAIFHVPIPAFNWMKREHLIEFDGTRWRTAIGTVVSTGCYANNSPGGVAPADGVFWLYITGQTTIWRTPDSELQVAPVEGSLNRTTNQMLMLAEREYVVTYECGGFAKPVTLWT